MARKIYVGHGKQVFFEGGTAVKYKGQDIYRCDNPRDWKNGGGQYITDLCNKSEGEMAEFLGYRTWVINFLDQNRNIAVLFLRKLY